MQSQELAPAPDIASTAPSPCEAEMYRRDHDSGYSKRRMFYVFCTTAFCLIAPTAFVSLGYTGPLVEKLVEGMINLISSIALLYLGAGVLDRSQILAKLGDGFQYRKFTRTESVEQSPPVPGVQGLPPCDGDRR